MAIDASRTVSCRAPVLPENILVSIVHVLDVRSSSQFGRRPLRTAGKGKCLAQCLLHQVELQLHVQFSMCSST